MASPSSNFYAELPALKNFLDITEPGSFAQIPPDWCVLLTDVKGSTQAIQAGRYKEVNMLGASSIVVILNAAGALDVPFVFGGDGATMLVPPELLDRCSRALLALQQLAEREFAMVLRVGIVPVADVLAGGSQILVAKFQISEHYQQAIFTGGGLAFAERLIKDPESGERFKLRPEGLEPEGDLSGLECRWQDIRSKHGETVSLLVMATSAHDERNNATYRSVLAAIERIYGGDRDYNPVAVDQLRASFSPRRLMKEVRLRAGQRLPGRLAYLARIFAQNILLKIFLRFDMTTGTTRWRAYPDLLSRTTDYKKYDDTLRMVIAGTAQQREALERYLEECYQRGELVYGLHLSDRAVMTCLVFERMGRQVHFVDGAGGGYTLAAKDLKLRLKQIPSHPAPPAEPPRSSA